jgi:hypothetical protein
LLLLPAICSAEGDRSQVLQAKLSSAVESYSLEARDPLRALLKAASDFKLAMGIEWMRRPGPWSPFKRTWGQTTVLSILEDIVAGGEPYTVDVSNGVVHVAPAAWRGDGSDILSARIESFAVKDEYVRLAAFRFKLAVLPIMEPRRDLVGGWGASIATGSGDRRVTFALKQPKVRDVLDELCLAADLKIWIVAYAASPTKTSAGFLRTAGLQSLLENEDSELPDQQQPSWAFIEWGRELR